MGNEIRNEIKSYIVASGWTIVDIIEKLKDYDIVTTPQALSNKLSRNTLRYSEILEIADIIGYEIKWERK